MNKGHKWLSYIDSPGFSQSNLAESRLHSSKNSSSRLNVCHILPGFIATNIAKNAVGITEGVLKNSRNALGMQADVFAQKALKAIQQRRRNVYIGGVKERLAMLLKRLMPGIFDWVIKRQKVT